MASWMIHLRIADQLTDRIKDLDETSFVMGNIAPDSGIPSADWTVYDPPKSVSHYKTKREDETFFDIDRFISEHFTAGMIRSYSRREFSFFLGYYVHLLTDVDWTKDIYRPCIEAHAGQYGKDKMAFIWEMKRDWYDLDFRYLEEHPDFRAFSVYEKAAGFRNDFMDIFSEDAFDNRREYICGFYRGEHGELYREYPYLAPDQADLFVYRTAMKILTVLEAVLAVRNQISVLRRILENSRRIVFFGGAGISTASGIPDFRSDTGLRADGPDPETILSKTFFYLQPEAFFDYYRKHMLFPNAKPNAVHRYLYELEKQDKLRGIVTQNVDGLHKAAGNIRVYELHGNVHENHCMECGASYPVEAILEASGIPRCECGGVIKPDVVLYGEPLEKYVCIGARREITNADTLIVAGTSLNVEPAASFIGDFRGKHMIIINKTPTAADDRAELVIRGDTEEVFRKLENPG